MALRTFYSAATSLTVEEVEASLEKALGRLELSLGRTSARDDGSRLVETVNQDGETALRLWIAPVEAGAFVPEPYDEGCPPDQAEGVRAVVKVGCHEGDDPRVAVLLSLAAAAALAVGGRVYDASAMIAMSADEASRRAAQPFSVGSFVTYHYLAPPSREAEHSWLHVHGMAKFFRPDLEAFDIHPDVSHRALALLLGVAAELAAGIPVPEQSPRPYGQGSYRLRPSEQARAEQSHFGADAFGGEHAGPALAVEDAGKLGSMTLLLRGAYELEPKSLQECEAERKVWQSRLAAIKAAWQATGDDTVVLRAGLAVGASGTIEHIWVEPQEWEGDALRAKLLNDAFADPSMTRGTLVSFDQGRISGIAVFRGRDALSEVETLRVLDPEAAARLDELLDATAPVRAVEAASTDGVYSARFEDDGRAAYVRVLRAADRTPLCEPLWLYNRLDSPPVLDTRGMEKGTLPVLSEVYTSQRRGAEAPAADYVDFEWSHEGLTVSLDGTRWAVVSADKRAGWSKLIVVPGRFGRPWSEVE